MELDFEKPLVEIEKKIGELEKSAQAPDAQFGPEIAELERKKTELAKEIYAKLTPWQIVQVARHPDRPLMVDYLGGMCSQFIELHGDRCFGDDPGVLGGLATFGDYRVVVIGHRKGKNVEENVKFNFGMANPEGYRKALRLMRLAEKYRLPVVSFIDTPGAYPGPEAEARGQAEAIARNLTEMSLLQTPIVVVVTGEGGSGGAIGIGVGDVVLMLANSIYSVISPEGCASILWRDGAKAPEAAAALRLTARDLLELDVVDEVIPEPPGGAHRNHEETISATQKSLLKHLKKLVHASTKKLVAARYEKYSRIGR
ncbi:MAG: acetyl-CoA carboxylase carboxyltransferase subunit alpha [Verrucomicrobiota bacterium]|nr:acetyl-CoA carboxylase carboxyltransferase subunit alpha [Verrucomicrobiota bacterium]